MRDADPRDVMPPEPFVDVLFLFPIKMVGALVQEKDSRPSIERTCQENAMLLRARKEASYNCWKLFERKAGFHELVRADGELLVESMQALLRLK